MLNSSMLGVHSVEDVYGIGQQTRYPCTHIMWSLTHPHQNSYDLSPFYYTNRYMFHNLKKPHMLPNMNQMYIIISFFILNL